jgi:hypothetical protein
LDKKSTLEIDSDYVEYVSSKKAIKNNKEDEIITPKSIILVQ